MKLRKIIFLMTFAAASGAGYLVIPAVIPANITALPSPQNQVKPERLEFPRDVTEATRKGSLKGDEAREYVLSASEGQTLSVKLDSKNRFLVFSVLNNDTMKALDTVPMPVQVAEWEGRAPRTGDYVIRVYLVRAGARRKLSASYTLKTSLRGNALAQTASGTGSGEQKIFTYRCDDNSEVAVTFFQTDPPKAQLNRNGQMWTLPIAPSGSGAKYSDGHTTFWTKGDEAMFELDGKTLNCKSRQ